MLQLFSIGLNQLNSDGTLQRDSHGARSLRTIKAPLRTSRAPLPAGIRRRRSTGDFSTSQLSRSLVANQNLHDRNAKQLLKYEGAVNDGLLPAGQTAEQDLADALDNIFNHPNVGPFISSILIQHLVTSNPSPAYIARVASVFDDNGQGVRGDLQAVIRAILLDPEARECGGNSNGAVAEGSFFGTPHAAL